jgi:hypothetical protein
MEKTITTTPSLENENKSQEKVNIVRERFKFNRTTEETEFVLRGTPRRIFRFTAEVDFPEMSFKDASEGKSQICFFTFIHDPTIRESTLNKLVEFRKIEEDKFTKTAAEAYQAGNKDKGDINMKLADIASNMTYCEGADDHYSQRLMYLSVECQNKDFWSEEMKQGIVSMLKEVGNKMKDIFEPRPAELRK